MVRQRTNVYLEEEDFASLEVIKKAHGLATNTAAVRFAVRLVADQIEWREADRRRARGERIEPRESGGTSDGAKGRRARGKRDGAGEGGSGSKQWQCAGRVEPRPRRSMPRQARRASREARKRVGVGPHAQ